MIAACTRCFGLESTLAPASSMTVLPLMFGNTVAIAARSIPAIRPRPNIAAAAAAPVWPAAIATSHFFSFTSLVATTTDASFLRRMATPGWSCMSIVSDACTICTGSFSQAGTVCNTLRIRVSSPTRKTSHS